MGFITQKLETVPGKERLLASIYYAFFTSGMMCTLIGAVLPFMKRDYNMSYALGGIVLSVHQIGNLCAVLFAGFLPYAIGRKKSTVILCTGIFAGFILMTLSGNPIILIVSFFLAGIGKGTMSNISNVVVAEVNKNKAAGLNILHASFALGALFAPATAIAAVTLPVGGWRTAAWFLAACEAAALLFLWNSSLPNNPSVRPPRGSSTFLKSGPFWLNTSILFFYLCCESAVTGWLVTYFVDIGVMSSSLAQSTASMLWIMMMAGRIVCAVISSKVNKNILLVILGLIQTVFFILMITSRNPALIVFSLLGVGLGMSGMYPTTLSTMPAEYMSSTVATGTCIACATIGAVVMPAIVGIIAQFAGIAGGVSAIGAAYIVMMCLAGVKLFVSCKTDTKRK